MTKTAVKKKRYTNKKNTKEDVKKTKPIDFTLLIVVLILLGLGIVMVLSASSPSALATSGNSYAYVVTQIQAASLRNFFNGNNL